MELDFNILESDYSFDYENGDKISNCLIYFSCKNMYVIKCCKSIKKMFTRFTKPTHSYT